MTTKQELLLNIENISTHIAANVKEQAELKANYARDKRPLTYWSLRGKQAELLYQLGEAHEQLTMFLVGEGNTQEANQSLKQALHAY
jgi:hypothetical protein